MYFLSELKFRNEPLYWFGLICLVGALVSLLLVRLMPVTVQGVSAWYKPFKFFLSTAIFLWTMAWYMHYLGDIPETVWLSWALIALFTFEDIYIFVQAGRGQLSHFNQTNGFYSAMFGLMGIAATLIALVAAYVGVLFFKKSFPELPAAYVWAIRLGFVIFVVFSMQGLTMGARLAHTVGAPDGGEGWPVVNWSKGYGDLRIAHFLGMHALQILPLIGFYVVRSVPVILLLGLMYFTLVVRVFLITLNGRAISLNF